MLDSLFIKEKDKLKATRQIFYKEDSMKDLKNNPGYIVLGSNFYQHSDWNYQHEEYPKNYHKRYVVDSLGNVMKKAVFIYMPAWIKNVDDYDLPENAKRFIHNVDDTLELDLKIKNQVNPVVIHYIKKEPEER